jgi:excisionase family DNA binding protein
VREILVTKEAAKRMGISQAHLRRLLEQGKVKGVKLGHDWIVQSLNYQRKRRVKGYNKDEGNI